MGYFISIFLTLYALVHVYIARKTWLSIQPYSSKLAWAFLIFIIASALVFPLMRIIESKLPYSLAQLFNFWGSYWLFIVYYSSLILIAIELIQLLINFFPQLQPFPLSAPQVAGGVILLLFVICCYGTINARSHVITNYDLVLPKKQSPLENLRIVMVSDMHLGWIYGENNLREMVTAANAQKPDLIFLVGDIIDEGISPDFAENLTAIMSELNPTIGTYAVSGNHEFISNQQDNFNKWLTDAGIHVLNDDFDNINDSLYIAGRIDASIKSFSRSDRGTRLELPDLMQKIPTERLPVILLDHQPTNLILPSASGIDLQFSGHTHKGQFFPNNFLTSKIYALDWGHYINGSFQAIISNGYGTWGPPVRIGNHPEMVVCNITFS